MYAGTGVRGMGVLKVGGCVGGQVSVTEILVRRTNFIENFGPPTNFFEKSGPGLKSLVRGFFFTRRQHYAGLE